MKKLITLLMILFLTVPARAEYTIVVEGWNKDFIAFKLAQWYKNGRKVKLVNLPGVGKAFIFEK
jgi:hypothetical protein